MTHALDKSPRQSSLAFVELTKQHKVLLAIVGLGAGALFVDRVVIGSGLSSPKEASAGLSETLGVARTTSPAGEGDVVTFATRIDAMEQPFDSASEAGSALASAFRPASTTGQSRTHAEERGEKRVALAGLRISSVMTRPVSAAMLNGHLIREGEVHTFQAKGGGPWLLLRGEQRDAALTDTPDTIHTVKLIAVRPRTAKLNGSATVLVNDRDRYEIELEASEKRDGGS